MQEGYRGTPAQGFFMLGNKVLPEAGKPSPKAAEDFK